MQCNTCLLFFVDVIPSQRATLPQECLPATCLPAVACTTDRNPDTVTGCITYIYIYIYNIYLGIRWARWVRLPVIRRRQGNAHVCTEAVNTPQLLENEKWPTLPRLAYCHPQCSNYIAFLLKLLLRLRFRLRLRLRFGLRLQFLSILHSLRRVALQTSAGLHPAL